jgi:class 3 adenylate cyclase/tetratricopeptide (TPR) repeat protein
MDIVVWLRSLGLGKYEAIFRENDIDDTVLPSLTHENLKELGVASFGHRVKLLDAIAALRSDASGKTRSVDATTTSSALSTHPEDRAERRQVTVMFSDLVGSTALSARMDPEDLREVISAYQKCVAETVQRFGGFVAKYMGDGVLIYFGYPQAHEDDAERAVRAGLELVGAVGNLNTHALLQTRVGIATGLVVVGDLIGSGASQEQAIVGETPNLAARLQGIADPNKVIVAENTRKLLGNLFEVEDLGAQNLKGIEGPVRAWAALRPSSVESRFDALHTGTLTELVGREEELELLLRRWSKAKTGEGQVVLLSGEPGIGKSRLTAAVLERIATEPHTRLRYFCSPQHSDSALYPIISQMERAAGFASNDAAQAKLDKLDTLLAQSFTPTSDAALFVDMLSLPHDGRYPIVEQTPQQRRQKTLEALTRQLEALSQSKPVLMIFEDVHWVDPTSLEALGRAVDRLRMLSILLIITYRPEIEPPWIGRPYVTALSLNRLGQREVVAMIDRVKGNNALPESIRQDIIERTDGIPLFVEEMTSAVLEAAAEGAAEQAVAAAPRSSIAVPPSLHASLMARLDRLGTAKEVAQIGAAIGREFSYALLAAATGKSEEEVGSALDRIVQAGLLFRQGVPPDATYIFKHALVQDAAYGTLLRARRIDLHARIARVLDQQFPDIKENNPEVIARHYTEAGLAPVAIDYWQRAGNRAAKRSANQEAVAHFRRAKELFEKLPDRAAHAEQELQLLIALGPALMTTRSSAAPEIGSIYARAGELARVTGRMADLFPTIWGAWLVAFISGDFAAANRLLNELFGVANTTKDHALVLQAHHAAWPTRWMTGLLADALQHIDRGLAFYRRDAHSEQAFQYGGHDPAVCGYTTGALIRTAMGYLDHGNREVEEAFRLARELNHIPTTIHTIWSAADLFQVRREPQRVEEFTDTVLPLLSQHGSAVSLANVAMLRGWAKVVRGESQEGIREVKDGLAAWRETGSRFQVTFRLARAAEACLFAGDREDGLKLANEALNQNDDTWFLPEVYRIRGELLYASKQSNDVEQCFSRALNIAEKQGARLLELRAAMSLARLWRDQGKASEARGLLAPVYGWFTEGFDTRDLKEANSLLDALAQR